VEGNPPDLDDLNSWAEAFGITAPVLSDRERMTDAIAPPGDSTTGYPRLVVIDRDMTVAVAQVTPATDASIRAAVEELL
jgi:hypothetical protein